MAEIVDVLRHAADGLSTAEIATTEGALTDVTRQLAATLTGTQHEDATAALQELRSAIRELHDAHVALAHAATGCSEYLASLGA
ncbi:hypothetical protein [Micromonospora polyrhachis]|uniref:C4-type Zn-finger protein n=1 Tax=Micromonospora polyrhachis TaxID=1282883 RepID=A0A7W7WQY8_9ACTN|nr:hypothetical protein [Micromonospora polyrhachis]MBB4960781.1 C4-type Zn-finger protein [Micromonospora polyrhachis]